MKKICLLLFLFMLGIVTTDAQMNTDNSYLRENYAKSKTAKRAAEKKAKRNAQKADKICNDAQSKTKNKAKDNADAPYLAGAVPTTAEGVVCFERTFTSSRLSKTDIFNILKDIAQDKVSETEHLEVSRIISESQDTLVASICEPLYFKKKKWEADSTIIKYQYFATVKDNSATLRIWFISYCYEQNRLSGFNYKAEEWITDKYALTKNKQRLLKGPGKFRRKTIEYVNELFSDIEKRIN